MDDQEAAAPNRTPEGDLAYLIENEVSEASLIECRGLARMMFEELGVSGDGVSLGRQVSLLFEVLARVADENRRQAFARRELRHDIAAKTTCFQVAAAAELLELSDEAAFADLRQFRCDQFGTTWEKLLQNAGKSGPATERQLRAALWLGRRSAQTGGRFRRVIPAVLESVIRRHLASEAVRAELIARFHESPDNPSLSEHTDVLGSTGEKDSDDSGGVQPTLPTSSWPGRGRAAWIVAGVVAACIAVATTVIVLRAISSDGNGAPSGKSSNAASAEAIERRYDGKDPRGREGEGSRCADPPPSQSVASSKPTVFGPDGKAAGLIELRTSPDCPVIWARVLWDGDPEKTYQIPVGWTLHVVAHRPATGTSDDLPERASDGPIQYGLGSMLATVRGCVYVEAYFTNGARRTATAQTSCVRP